MNGGEQTIDDGALVYGFFMLRSDMLNEEPPWTEGETCLECGVKFSISTRKHHW